MKKDRINSVSKKLKSFFDWEIVLGLVFITISISVYFIHYLIFRDSRHIFIYLIGDIAFVFFEVFLVTLIIHRLLVQREKQAILKKLNMVIGSFFIETGIELVKKISALDLNASRISKSLVITKEWSEKDFQAEFKYIKDYEPAIEVKSGIIHELKIFLVNKRQFLLNLLGNPNLLEHESFTDLLWAVFHLTDELAHRADLAHLPDIDYDHLSLDIKRAYMHLVSEWLYYMKHLKQDYPYLFSLAMRTNPFDKDASVVIVK